jgi:hemolysin D
MAMVCFQPSPLVKNQFDKPVILRQAPHWSRAVIWGIVGVTVATIGWACLAKFEEAVPAQGKLEPKGVVQPVQAPVGGVIDDVFVEEGAAVEAGDVLVTFDPRPPVPSSLPWNPSAKTKRQKTSYYRSQLADQIDVSAPLEIAPGIAQLTSNRATLVAENNLYRAQLAGDATGETLPPLNGNAAHRHRRS